MLIALKELRSLVSEALADEGPSKRDELISVYSDVYKEKYGIRPRWRYQEFERMTDEEIEAELNALYDEPGDVQDDGEEYGMELKPHEPGYYPEPEGTVTDDEMKDVHAMENEPSKAGMRKHIKA